MASFETFDQWQRAVDRKTAQVWMANGGGLAFDPINPGLCVGHVFHDPEDETWELREARVDSFQRLMDFIWADGPNPVKALRRLLVVTRCGSPQHLAMMNQTDVSVLLNETRAAVSLREGAVWQKFMTEAGFFKSKRPLMKGEQAKQTYAEAAEGNSNRKGGKRAIKKYSVLREQHAKSKSNSKRKRKPKPPTL